MVYPLKAMATPVAVLIVWALLGCGSGDATTEPSKNTAARARKAHAIKKLRWEWDATIACKKGMERADLVMHEAAGESAPHPPSSAPDWGSFKLPVKVLLPTFRQTVSELVAVKTLPQESRSFENALEKMREDLKWAERHSSAPISSRPLASGGRALAVYGIHACLY